MKGFWDGIGAYIYIVVMLIVTIAGFIFMLSMFLPNEVLIQSWQPVVSFSIGIFLWLIPVQLINGLKLLPIQRRNKRIVFPYLLTLLQVSVFVLYVVNLNSLIVDLHFSSVGLIIFVTAILLYTKLLKDKIVRYEQMLRKEQNKSLG